MPYVLVQQKVEDYSKWKAVFDENVSLRRENGSKGGSVFRSTDNPAELAILLEWDNLEKAKEFVQSDRLREQMKRAGVIGKPDIHLLDEVAKADG